MGGPRGSRVPKAALALAMTLSVLYVPVPGAAVGQCIPPDIATENIILANPLNEQTTITETIMFVVAPLYRSADPGLPVNVDTTLESQAQGVDAMVVEITEDGELCALVGGSYSVSGSDGGANQFTMRMRFYDEDLGLTGPPSPCAAELSGPIPSGTSYAVVVLCTGVPYGLHGLKPTSVEVTLLMST